MEMTYVQAINAGLREALDRDPSVFMMGEDIAHFGGMFRVTEGLLETYGSKRIIDTPISESGFIGMGLGSALAGKKPVIELMFIDFALVAMDQILNNIAKTCYMTGGRVPVPLTIITQGGGYKGAAAQHSQMLEALFLHLPGIKVVTPSNPSDAKSLIVESIFDPNPVVFIEHKQLLGSKGEVVPGSASIGRANVVRSGSKVSVFTYSYTTTLVMQAVEELGLDIEVVDLVSLNPLDWDTIAASVTKTHRVLVTHESHSRCGVGRDLAAQIGERLFDELDAPVRVFGAADVPIPFAKSLEDEVLPTVESIKQKIMETLNG
jgi:pyruvate/2-oxoglutarate/acetoin dehydrogenase E1 component